MDTYDKLYLIRYVLYELSQHEGLWEDDHFMVTL